MAARVNKEECIACGACVDVCPVEAISLEDTAVIDAETCTSCETCVERCPAKALTLSGEEISVDLDRCFGCGVCAVGCPAEAIKMTEKEAVPIPPVNRKELTKAIGVNY